MVKDLYDFTVPSERPWFAYGVVGSTMLLSIGMLMIVFNVEPQWISLVIMEFSVVWAMFCVWLSVSQDEIRERLYDDYLSGVEVDSLRMVSASMEFDTKTKDYVVCFLNKRHPGWSLQHV